MSPPAPCARITAGVRPPRRKPGGSATTPDTAPPPGSAIRRRWLARLLGGRGARVFADPAARARLGALVHPLIAAEVGRRIAAARAEGFDGPLVVEAAVLLEAGWRPLVDRVWVVSTRREHAIARIVAARGLTREEVERRLDAQLSDAERRRQADLVIENDGPPAALQAAVEAAWRTLVW